MFLFLDVFVLVSLLFEQCRTRRSILVASQTCDAIGGRELESTGSLMVEVENRSNKGKQNALCLAFLELSVRSLE